jgi:hypothetical protein
MAYWQIAAGSVGRDYSDRFIRHGLAFVGGDEYISRMTQVRPGDIVVLKRGLGQILAVGEVVDRNGIFRSEGDKDWLFDFDGWELPAWCNVDWHMPETPIPTSGLTRATMQSINTQHIIDIATRILTETPRRDIMIRNRHQRNVSVMMT